MFDRLFLGSETHLLHALSLHLISTSSQDDVIDLRGIIVMLPTSRSRRRLQSLLLRDTAALGHRLVPPDIVTPRHLPDRLIVPPRTIASGIASSLAWFEATRSLSDAQRLSVLGHDDVLSKREIHALAMRLDRTVRQCAAADLRPSEVPARLSIAGLPDEADRWAAIASAHDDMVSHLGAMGMVDRDDAHADAVQQNRLHLSAVQRILFVAADLSKGVQRLLEVVAEQGVPVTAVVHGDERVDAAAFDSWGRIDVDVWADREIVLPEPSMLTCPRDDDEIATAFEVIAKMGEIDADQVRIMVPDERRVPRFMAAARSEGAVLDPGSGIPLSEHRVGHLLHRLLDLVEPGSGDAMGQFVRHPDVERWLVGQGVELPVLYWDAVWSQHVPAHLDELTPLVRQENHRRLVEHLLAIRSRLQGHRSASQWGAVLLELLADLLSHDGSEDVDEAMSLLHAELTDVHELPRDAVEIGCDDVIQLLLGRLSTATLPPHRSGGVELIGWLDAHLDDSPHLILTAMNEGIVPAGADVDPWLPERCREALGMETHRRRSARDAALLHAMLGSGRTVTVICPRMANDGEPRLPSSLLLRQRGVLLAERISSLFHERPDENTMLARRSGGGVGSRFSTAPMPEGDPVIPSMRVTDFRAYLDDPWRFMLERDRRIEAAQVLPAWELDAMGLGTLLHKALEVWGLQERDSDTPTVDARQIEADMVAALHDVAATRFGAKPAPGVRLQIAMIARRFTALAARQAARAADGWRLHLIEADFNTHDKARHVAPMIPDAGGLPVTGKIDRVDLHDSHGYQALDYKSSISADGAVASHQTSKGRWTDLQLPLYRVLLRSIDVDVPPRGLGFITIPPDPDSCRFDLADWSLSQMEQAEAVAADIIEIIVQGRLRSEAQSVIA